MRIMSSFSADTSSHIIITYKSDNYNEGRNIHTIVNTRGKTANSIIIMTVNVRNGTCTYSCTMTSIFSSSVSFYINYGVVTQGMTLLFVWL